MTANEHLDRIDRILQAHRLLTGDTSGCESITAIREQIAEMEVAQSTSQTVESWAGERIAALEAAMAAMQGEGR